MDGKRTGAIQGLALQLLALSLAGCAPHPATANAIQPGEQRSALQPPARAVIYFRRPMADSKQLSLAISEACHCQPVFFRPYLGDALIYQISLPPGHTFAAFEQALMRNADRLGIRAVEQDSIMQPQ